MIRALLGGILRILLWFFAFYLIMHAIRAIVRAFLPSSGRRRPDADAAVGGTPKQPAEQYDDVHDAHFSDLNERKSDPPAS